MAHKIVFFGNERLATGVSTDAPVLKALIENGYEICALVVAQREQGSSRKPRPLEVVELAENHGIDVLSPSDLKAPETAEKLAGYDAKAGVLVAYGKIVPQSIIDLFPRGIVNVHPSLLPKHRGSTPIESVIRDGDDETGVSLMALVSVMDAGPVYAQEVVGLLGDEDKVGLTDQLSRLGSEMMIRHLPEILAGSNVGSEPDHSLATEDKRISKEDGILDFNKSAEQLEREVRAYSIWPRSKTTLGNMEVIITKAHVTDMPGEPGQIWQEGKELGIHTSEGTLVIDSLMPVGKKEMPACAFLAGYSLSS